MPLQSITDYRLTDHASQQMKRREISETEVANVLAKPEQTEMIREGRAVYQAHIKYGAPSKEYLLRGLLILKTPHQVL